MQSEEDIWAKLRSDLIEVTQKYLNESYLNKTNLEKFEDHMNTPSLYTYLMAICTILVMIFGICGNTLVLFASIYRKNMRNTHNAFIGTLAMADLLHCLVTLPINFLEIFYQKWVFGQQTKTLCSLIMAAEKFPMFLSSMAIVAIAWVRYRCVFKPER